MGYYGSSVILRLMISRPEVPATGHERFLALALRAAWFAFFAALFLSLTAPIDEPDFWWHLASGKWMWEHSSLLRTDPFSVPFDSAASSRGGDFVLKQYWLAQFIQYGVYALAGFKALVLLRASVHTLMFYLLRRLLAAAGAGNALCAGLLFVSAVVVTSEVPYVTDRPQMWSGLFALILIAILEALRRDSRWSRWALPTLMLLWSNMHGGFLYGDALIAAFMLGAFLTRTGHPVFYRVSAFALLISGLNPNGFNAAFFVLYFLPAAGGAGPPSTIAEMRSIFSHVTSLAAFPRWFPYLFGLFLVSAGSWLLPAGRSGRRRLDLLLPYLLVTVMGARAIRFLILYVPLAALVTAANASAGLEAVRADWLMRVKRVAPWVALALLVLGVSRFAPAGILDTVFGGVSTYQAPAEQAAEFVKSHGLKGNLFNEYNYGGYLIWALSPANRVFIDGRVLSVSDYQAYKIAMDDPEQPTQGSGGPLPAYRRLFDERRIDLVITPGCDPPSGALIRLPLTLARDPGWALVYADSDNLVFARVTLENRPQIQKLLLPPSMIGNHLIAMAASSARQPHSSRLPNWRYTMAFGHFLRGDLRHAIASLDEYLALVPQDEEARRARGNFLNGTSLKNPGRAEEAPPQPIETAQLYPSVAVASFNLGVGYFNLGRMSEAAAAFRQAVQLDPAIAEAHYNLGVCAAMGGDLAGGIAHFRKALRYQPEYFEAQFNLGLALEKTGARQEALEHYLKALLISPDDRGTQAGVQRLLGKK